MMTRHLYTSVRQRTVTIASIWGGCLADYPSTDKWIKKEYIGRAWWPLTPALKKQKQADHCEFNASLIYIETCVKKKKNCPCTH